MKNRTGFGARLEYLAIRFLGFLFQMFPIDLNLRTARLIGDFWWIIDRRHRDRTMAHIRFAFGDAYSDADVERIARQCFRHWTMYAVEFLCGMRLINEWNILRYVTPVDLKPLFELMLDKRGVILVTGHYGNFELSGYLFATVGFEAVAVMRPLDNVYLNDYVVRTRAKQGLRLLSKTGVGAEAEDILKRGGAIGFVADQDAGRKGVFVDFFGHPASTYKSIALLAMACETPIVVGAARRSGARFHYELVVERVIMPDEWADKDDPLRWITQTYSSALEDVIRRAPEQYLWLHRRWKTAPGTPRKAKQKRDKNIDATSPAA